MQVSEQTRLRHRRLAVGFVFAGLLLAVSGVIYLGWSGRERSLPAVAATRPVPPDLATRTEAMLRMLILVSGILLTFIVGSYVMVKLGRAFLARREERTPTQYVDAWSNYRLTEEEIARTMAHLEKPSEGPPDGPSASDSST